MIKQGIKQGTVLCLKVGQGTVLSPKQNTKSADEKI